MRYTWVFIGTFLQSIELV